MRFMMLMIPGGYETAEPGTMPEDLGALDAMMAYNQSLEAAGILRDANGLHPPSMGARVSFRNGKPLVTDGPFAETKEVLGGYWIIEVGSRAEAIDWASRCPAGDNEIIEIRQIQEAEDWNEEARSVMDKYPDVLDRLR
ncbi:MAG: YciI family protein [Rhizobiaceae bacterium]|nr:YciI family protein [Rhizobiaceae bacterium]MCV0408223.1 YciI family protein [Rhizobiaceae bacterium]